MHQISKVKKGVTSQRCLRRKLPIKTCVSSSASIQQPPKFAKPASDNISQQRDFKRERGKLKRRDGCGHSCPSRNGETSGGKGAEAAAAAAAALFASSSHDFGYIYI
ncbi:hypothetical protein BDA96_03G135900 [Sorghum bicolor]|uniref:Uncharacterized protein n=2 Tax=Sorghum bicolor TaxID=4558 RepID=A0A921RE10_SORBI|nr:hypothetical protein BDA96_03G135900 [Sorghum bicolor]KXG32257.1 hypothetical protein SORBI_3003G129700 [Sorghum bicolor]